MTQYFTVNIWIVRTCVAQWENEHLRLIQFLSQDVAFSIHAGAARRRRAARRRIAEKLASHIEPNGWRFRFSTPCVWVD